MGEIPVLPLPSVVLAERIAQASMSETIETGEFPSRAIDRGFPGPS